MNKLAKVPTTKTVTVSAAETATVPSTETATAPTAKIATTPAAETTTVIAALPDGYLNDGYFATTDKGAKYLRPDYVGAYAQGIAAALSPMKPSDFASLLRGLKRSKKGMLPFEARKTALLEMRPKAILLVHRKRAPQILSDLIDANIAAVDNDEKWMAFFRHCEAIQGFLYATVN